MLTLAAAVQAACVATETDLYALSSGLASKLRERGHLLVSDCVSLRLIGPERLTEGSELAFTIRIYVVSIGIDLSRAAHPVRRAPLLPALTSLNVALLKLEYHADPHRYIYLSYVGTDERCQRTDMASVLLASRTECRSRTCMPCSTPTRVPS